MFRLFIYCLTGLIAWTLPQWVLAGTDVYFNPLTQSSAVATRNHINELNSPWQTPPGLRAENLTSMEEIEADFTQSVLRVPDFGNSTLELIASMWDMVSFNDTGKFIFIPHETFVGAGASRYDVENDRMELLFSGDLGGFGQNWDNDWAAFDPSLWTPQGTVLLGEEWNGEGRIIEITNPLAPAEDIVIREVESLVNVAHEGLRFSRNEKTLYMVDEWNSGSIYKFVLKNKGNLDVGQTFVLSVDDFDGDAADLWNDPSNEFAPRTGEATWIPLTDKNGNPLTAVDPFRNGPTNDPRANLDTRGGRPAADEVGATPYGRPEDIEVGRLKNRREVVYFTATSENAVYSIEMRSKTKAIVRMMASQDTTPKNLGFPATTAVLNSPDNLTTDALGNLYVVEDAPNTSDVGGDVWFVRDTNGDGVAESLDHFLSTQVSGSETTGMIFSPVNPTPFLLSIQHPDSTNNLDFVPDGFGDALWVVDLENVVPPVCKKGHDDDDWDDDDWDDDDGGGSRTCSNAGDFHFIKDLKKAGRRLNRRTR